MPRARTRRELDTWILDLDPDCVVYCASCAQVYGKDRQMPIDTKILRHSFAAAVMNVALQTHVSNDSLVDVHTKPSQKVVTNTKVAAGKLQLALRVSKFVCARSPPLRPIQYIVFKWGSG